MNPLQMNLKAQINRNQSVTSRSNDFMKRKEGNVFDAILSKNVGYKKEFDFKESRDKKPIEKIDTNKKSNVQNKTIGKKKPAKNSKINKKEVEKIESEEKENSNEEVSKDIMDLLASLNKLLEEMDTKTQVEGNNDILATKLEKLKLQLKEMILNIEKNSNVDIQNNMPLKEALVDIMNQFEIFMNQNGTKVESEDFNELVYQIKALLENNEYDKTKDMRGFNDAVDKNTLQSKEDSNIDIETIRNEVSANTKNETEAGSENQRQMSQNKNKENKMGFFANKDQKTIISDKVIQDIPTNYSMQNDTISRGNIKIEGSVLQKPNFNNILEQFIEKAQVIVDEKGSEMSLQLKPNNLGNLSMKIAVEKGIVIANIVAENQIVKEVLESNFNVLRDALNEKGFAISELNVSVGQDSNFQNQQNFMNFNKKNSNKMTVDKLNYEDSISNEETSDISSMSTSKINHLG